MLPEDMLFHFLSCQYLAASLIRDQSKLYKITDAPEYTHISDYNLADAIRKEEALLMADHLGWFDRTVLGLYLEGWSMAELARQTGISVDVLYKSISQSKKRLRRVVRLRSN